MNRTTILVAGLGALLLLVVFYLFGWSPKQDEMAELEAEIDQVLVEQTTIQNEIRALEEVRATAPEIEARLAAADALIPSDAALPSALRQLQQAADDSGVTLTSVAFSRPAAVADVEELAAIEVTVIVSGSYYQTVDLLRRIEDPAITPRGILWDSAAVAPEDYPVLSTSLSGTMFALIPAPPEPVEPEAPTETPTDGATETEGEG